MERTPDANTINFFPRCNRVEASSQPQQRQAEPDKHKAEFFANGGKVTHIPTGASVHTSLHAALYDQDREYAKRGAENATQKGFAP